MDEGWNYAKYREILYLYFEFDRGQNEEYNWSASEP